MTVRRRSPLNPGDILTLSSDPPDLLNADGSVPDWSWASTAQLTLYVADASGRTGTVSAALTDFTLALAGSKDPVVQEFALVSSVSAVAEPFPHTRILLQSAAAQLLRPHGRRP